MKILPVLFGSFALASCTTAQLSNLSAEIDFVNAQIKSVDDFAHQFCPSARVIGLSAQAIACTAAANNVSVAAVNAAVAWGQQFCANPASTNVASLVSNATKGVWAVTNAVAQGCAGRP